MNQKVRFFSANTDLKSALAAAPPRSAREALAAAEANLANLEEDCQRDVAASIERLADAAAQLKDDTSPASFEAVYDCSARIIGAASIIGRHEIVALAVKLCDLIEAQNKQNTPNAKPVGVLVDSIGFLFTHAGEDNSSLITGVGDMLKHVGDNI